MSNTTKFDAVLNALSAFEQGMAELTLKSKKGIIASLETISSESTVLINQGSLPPGTKSTLLKIRKVVKETADGLRNDIFQNLTPVRKIAHDHVGTLHAALVQQLDGGLSADQKEQVRSSYVSDEDKAQEIERLIKAFDPGTLLVAGVKRPLNDALTDVSEFLDRHFTLSQLRSIRPYLPEETAGGEPKKDPDCKWNQITYPEILAADVNDPKGKARLSSLKRELVQKHDDELAELSESYKELVRRLPKQLRGPFSMVYYPVVPIFQDIAAYKNPTRLENAGLSVKRIGDHFLVLENQMLLCVDLDRIGVKGSLRLTRDGQRMKTVKNSSELEQEIIKIVGLVNETAKHTGTKLAIASDTIVRNPNNSRIALVWLIDEKVRRNLSNLLNNTKVTWDIPRHKMTDTKD
uniref:Uncharacterized protein n=1 Tax=Pseudomonas phage HRDY3 TaxID=3236930 RepID=A0AB39CE54_9VIRU